MLECSDKDMKLICATQTAERKDSRKKKGKQGNTTQWKAVKTKRSKGTIAANKLGKQEQEK